MIARLGGQHVVEFSLQDPQGMDLPAESWSELPGVTGCRYEGGVVHLSATEPHVVLPALLDGLAKRGWRLASLMKRSHFLAAVILSRLLFALPEVFLVLLLARLIFGVAVAGSYLAIGLLILLGCLEFAGIGLLMASRAQTIETVSGLMNAVMLPMWIGSGIFFSTQRFPQAVQPALNLLPLTPLIDALRRVMLEGAGLASQGVNLAIIAAWGCATFALALRWFRWS